MPLDAGQTQKTFHWDDPLDLADRLSEELESGRGLNEYQVMGRRRHGVSLEEAQAPFTSRYFDPASFEQYSPRFPQNTESMLNLEREGPVLVDGGMVLSGSFFILEYIAEANPGAQLLPADPLGRYRTRAWGQFNALQLAPGACALGCAKYLAPTLKALDQEQLRARI